MHHAYIQNQVEVIAMLKEAGFKKKEQRDIIGQLPVQCRHMQFAPDSDADFTDDSSDEVDSFEYEL